MKRCAVIPIDDEIAVERLSHNYPTANRNHTGIWKGMISPIYVDLPSLSLCTIKSYNLFVGQSL